MRRLELAGQRFGSLVAIKAVGSSNQNGVIWECECDCGNKTQTYARFLKSGNTTSCGCSHRIEMIGRKFGRLRVIRLYDKQNKRLRYKCKCDCGNTSVVDGYKLRSGETRSCGCIVREGKKDKQSDVVHRLKRIYRGIIQRCTNPESTTYKWYGAKGVRVCNEWAECYEAFEKWAVNNGYDNDLTIDRIDPNGDYSPDNCRWLTIQDQQRNRRNAIRLEINGEVHSVSEWSKISGTKEGTIYYRHGKGLSDYESVYGVNQ